MLITWFVFAVVLLQGCKALPQGFEDQGVHRLKEALDVRFATDSDGKDLMFAITKDGEVYTITNFETDDESKQTKVLSLDLVDRICDDGERGLGGILPHPNFASNRYIYLFYTRKNFDDNKTNKNEENYGCVHDKEIGPRNICSRFTVKDDLTIDKDSEKILFKTAPLDNKIHNGGDMAFGVDGMLYVTVGDAGERGLAYAQKTNNLFGTILRITETGDIPDDNPFIGGGTARCNEDGQTSEGIICREIFSYGLRNPFRFTMDPHSTNKVRFLINDVGGKRWEETNVGGADYAGVNYGWPQAEGVCNFASNTKCPVYDDFEDPLLWYEHNAANQGAAVGITIVPPGLNWPSKYRNPSFFFIEFVLGIIYLAEDDQSNYCRDCVPPTPGYKLTEFHEWSRPVALRFGPYKNTQALYYTAREGSLNIRRIVYKSGGNSAPSAKFSVSKEVVSIGETVSFDASASSDPDPNETLTYQWGFGDGNSNKSGVTVQHKFTAGGTFIVKLVVKDSKGFSDNEEIEISVGVPPTVKIISPSAETQFAVGDFISLQGTGTDAEGNPLDPANLYWEVRQHHGDHYHPFFSKEGIESAKIGPAPEPEDFLAAMNSYLEVRLTGYDSFGLHSTVSLNILPKTVLLDFDSFPSGLTISLDEEELVMPQRIMSWENHNLRVVAPDQGDYIFAGWSTGKVKDGVVNVPAASSDLPKFQALFFDTAAEAQEQCFSAINTVNVQGKGRIYMDELQIGDLVEGSDGTFSRVYSFGRLLEDIVSLYIQIQASNLDVPLELSRDHIVFLEGKLPVRAEDVKVGDRLFRGNEVLAINIVKRKGVYAPITETGEIMVSGVLASNYVALLNFAPSYQQSLVHSLYMPLRLLCIYDFEYFCINETYTEGFSDYAYYLAKAGLGIQKYSVWVQIGSALLVAPLGLCFKIAESCFVNRALIYTLVFILALMLLVRGKAKIQK